MGCIALVLFTRAFGLRHVVSCKLYKHIWKRMTPSPPPAAQHSQGTRVHALNQDNRKEKKKIDNDTNVSIIFSLLLYGLVCSALVHGR